MKGPHAVLPPDKELDANCYCSIYQVLSQKRFAELALGEIFGIIVIGDLDKTYFNSSYWIKKQRYPKYTLCTVHSVLEGWYIPEVTLYDFNAELFESQGPP